jgi:DNA primase
MSDRLRTEIELLKRATSITAVIGETLRLKRCGQLQHALCPFHADKNPSFYVYPAHPAHYHCYGCDAHGDIFDWLEKARGMMFREAVKYLGGAPLLPSRAPMTPRRTTQHEL